MRWSIVTHIDEVPAADWNALSDGANPFVRHEFLAALERNGCVGGRSGWLPHHLLLHDAALLVGALPMYVKLHSYGEYVFDWAWAEAFERYGMAYYPKLVVAVPYTPAPGPRLLALPGPRADSIRGALVEAAIDFAREIEVSSVHWLFTNGSDGASLGERGLAQRIGCQFHWHNEGFADFEHFLSRLTSKRRKQIKRERRQASAHGLVLHTHRGHEVGEAQWEAFHRFYCSTYDRKWGMPYLSAGFFKEVGRTLGDSVVLVLATRDERYVAGSLCFQGSEALYGRNWGCDGHYSSLHYEMCYYRTIEHCIERGLARFEAGAQGEYKISRGLLPCTTHSWHWVRDPQFRAAVDTYVRREARGVMRYMSQMDEHSPFKTSQASQA